MCIRDSDDVLELPGIRNAIENGTEITVKNITKGTEYKVTCELSERGKGMMLAGGLLNYTKHNK